MSADINSSERAILTAILKRRGWQNTTQIANSAGVSWNTADKYIRLFYGRGWLQKKGNYWKAKR